MEPVRIWRHKVASHNHFAHDTRRMKDLSPEQAAKVLVREVFDGLDEHAFQFPNDVKLKRKTSKNGA